MLETSFNLPHIHMDRGVGMRLSRVLVEISDGDEESNEILERAEDMARDVCDTFMTIISVVGILLLIYAMVVIWERRSGYR